MFDKIRFWTLIQVDLEGKGAGGEALSEMDKLSAAVSCFPRWLGISMGRESVM